MEAKLKDGSEVEDVQDARQHCSASVSMYEISVIDNMASFLEAHGGSRIDPKVLRNMAEALSKKMNDTSPGTLQDVTMDNSYGVGYRSPCVQQQQQYQSPSSPTNGPARSVRDFEEQMASLRKENFNLKLRLYFIEESTPGYKNQNVQDGQETMMKQLIDSKVELEILRKDLQDKQGLLKEAAQAMNQMEQIQKDNDSKYLALIEELQQKIQFLEMERDAEKSGDGDFMKELLESSEIAENKDAKEKIRELEELLTTYEGKVTKLTGQIQNLDDLLVSRDATVAKCEAKIKELVFQNDELNDKFEIKSQESVNAMRHVRGLRVRISDLKASKVELENKCLKLDKNYATEKLIYKKLDTKMNKHLATLKKMQSTIDLMNLNTARMLERLQQYEQIVSQINMENNASKSENRFFRSIIEKFRKTNAVVQNMPAALFVEVERALTDFQADGDGHSHSKDDAKKLALFKWRNLSFTNIKNYQRIKLLEFKPSLRDLSSSGSDLLPKISSRLIHFSASAEDFREEVENDKPLKKTKQLREELQEQKSEMADKMCMLQEAEEKLKSREQIHEQACRTIQKLMLTIKNQQTQIKTLQSQNASKDFKESSSGGNNTSNGLNCTGVCESLPDTEAFNDLCVSEKQKLEAVIAEQDATIENLKSEVKKKTANLQNLVNRELWEKNREIERLTKLVNDTSSCSPIGKLGQGDELQKSFSDVDYNKAVERNKLLQKKVDILIQRLSSEGSSEAAINKLRSELRESREDAEQAEKWRRECADVCSVLTNRLEELAGFLNSLLKHKDVLGVLAADRRRAIRKAVDRSLDLSKSLNMTLSFSAVSFVDQSFAQLSNLSDILGDVDGNENKTFNSHEELHARKSMENLRAENNALKKELDKRRGADTKKDRRSLPLAVADNQSESEAWSEPDRKVSLARIGLEDNSASLSKETMPQQLDTDSESDALNQSRNSKARTQERIVQLEQLVAQRDDRILEIQCQLVDADNRLKKENLRVLDMTNELEHLRTRNEELHADLVAIGSQDESHDHSMLKHEIEEKTTALEKLEEERQRLSVEVHMAHMEVQKLRDEKDEVIRKTDEALAMAAAEEQLKINALRQELETVMEQRLCEQERDYAEKVERDWIARAIHETVCLQLNELQRQYIEMHQTINSRNEIEQQLRQDFIAAEAETRALRKQLDEGTMQVSKALVDRTKAFNEKFQLEEHVAQLQAQLAAIEAERNSLQENVRELQEQEMAMKMTKLNGSDVSQSGYTSEDVPQMHAQPKGPLSHSIAANVHRLNNSSPDLGIESDAGRVSSVELTNAQRPQLRVIELCNSHLVSDIKEESLSNDNSNPSGLMQPQLQPKTDMVPIHDCAKVEQENIELRRKLVRTKRAFEDTYEKLRTSNQKKAQIEKDIKSQILKTHNVLRNVRANMENEL